MLIPFQAIAEMLPVEKMIVYLMLTYISFSTHLVLGQVTGNAVQKKKVEIRDKKKKKASSKDEVIYSGKSAAVSVNVSSKKNDLFIIDWLKPTRDNVAVKNGTIEIKLKILSSSVVRNEHVTVLHNQQLLGSKMDVSGLFGNQNEFTYSNAVPLVEGVNEIIVKVSTEKGEKASNPLVIHKKGTIVSVQPMGASLDANGHTSVYWWTAYDPATLNGKPYVHKEKMLPVKFKLITNGSVDISKCRVVLNNKFLTPTHKAKLQKDSQGNYSFEDDIALEERDSSNEIFLEVVSSSGTARSEKLNVNYSPFRPNLHILAIGTETNLQYTVKDARDFARLFTNQGGTGGNRLFNKINIDTLIGPKATAQEIKGTIEELKIRYFTGTIGPEDVLLTFISSHGFLLNDDFRVQGNDYSPTRQRSTSVSFRNEVVAILEAIPCKKIILIDACHSGGARANPADINFEITKLNSIRSGLSVFASSRGEEQSYEDVKWQNGAFTKALMKALKEGKADKDGNGIVSLQELHLYVSKEVSSMVKVVKNRPQNPVLVNDELGDVAIYVIE